MRERIAMIVLGLALTMIPTAAFADDADDVKAAYARHITLSRTGQVDAFLEQHEPGHTAFGPNGALLSRFDSLADEKKFRQAAASRVNPEDFDSQSVSQVVRHMEVQIYGNAAILATYLQGPITLPDGTQRPGTRRVTSVWIKQGNRWTEVHDHMSPLIP
jgi:ketosteroid isomerase-like protein